jgi:hypothetical protein
MQQLDIFLDSEPVQRANDLIEALSLFDCSASKRSLNHLKIADPNHADLPQFQVLCDFLDQGLKSSNQLEAVRHLAQSQTGHGLHPHPADHRHPAGMVAGAHPVMPACDSGAVVADVYAQVKSVVLTA